MNTYLVGTGLMLLQFLLALPWASLVFLSREEWASLKKQPFAPWVVQRLVVALAFCVGLPVLVLNVVQDKSSLEIAGRTFAASLQLQNTVNLSIAAFALMLLLS